MKFDTSLSIFCLVFPRSGPPYVLYAIIRPNPVPKNGRNANGTSMTEGKKLVFDYLKDKSDPAGIQELRQHLGLPERSIRRWLLELVGEGVIVKSGHTKNAKYVFRSKEEKFPYFSEASKIVLKKVEIPLYQRPPITYNEAWLKSYIPNKTHYLLPEISRRLEEAGTRTQGLVKPVIGCGFMIFTAFSRMQTSSH